MTNQSNNIFLTIMNMFLTGSFSSDFIQWFIIAIILTFQAKILYKGIREQSKKYSDNLNSLGLFGTFLGICIGLWYLNPNDITSSIPGFIGSMKVAFMTSVSGLLSSLILNYKVKDESSENAELSDVVEAIKVGNMDLSSGIKGIKETVQNLSKSISGTEEGSLLNQMVLMRSNMNDKFDSLNNEFRDFAKLQAENNTRALVDAIREVIGDFNTKLNEQFGENFKELNNAVGDLVTWQENYKEVVKSTYEKINMASDAIETSKKMLESVQKRFTENMTINKEVKDAIDVLTKENEKMIYKMEAFSQLSETAKDAFPTIKANIEGLTDGISKQVEGNLENIQLNMKAQHKNSVDLISNINQSINDLREGVSSGIDSNIVAIKDSFKSVNEMTIGMISDVNKDINSSLETMKNGIGEINGSINQSVGNLTDSIDESSKIISEKMLATFSESMSNIEQIQQKIGDQMEATILQIDDALRQEMEKSLQSLGNQLASVSQKFVEDYTKLTNQMRIVVSQSDKFVN